MHAKAWQLFVGSFAIVVMQCAVAFGVLAATELPGCKTNDHCISGMYCRVGVNKRCEFCSDSPLLMQTDQSTGYTYNKNYDPNYAGVNETYAAEVCAYPAAAAAAHTDESGAATMSPFVTNTVIAWCDNCVHSGTGSVDTLSLRSMSEGNIEIMKAADWVALVFSIYVVALKLCGELKDIQLCSIAIAKYDAQLSSRWKFGLRLLGGIRRWTFLNGIVCLVAQLVFLKGGDALSVCKSSTHGRILWLTLRRTDLNPTIHCYAGFNTVAILFITEVRPSLVQSTILYRFYHHMDNTTCS
jgi:hypothetical protein